MRILHISRTMGQGGAEKIVYQLCRDNLKCTQMVMSCGGEYESELKQIGVSHYQIPDMDRKNPFSMLYTFFKILKLVKKERIEIIHSHHRMAAFYARLVSALTKCKHVYTAHNIFSDKKRFLQFALNGAAIVAVGEGVKRNLTEFYEVDDKRITVIHNTIKIEKEDTTDNLFESFSSQGKVLVGTIGRIVPQKGIDIFIKSVKKARDKNADIIGVIVGDGTERAEMESLVRKLEMENYIIFMGFQKAVLTIISQMDFLVLSSRWEGLPLTPIEVFSQGKTMIASDISGNNEVITNNYNGLLCQADKVSDFAEKICRLANDTALRKKLEENAKKTYNEKFKYEIFVEKYCAVYDKCCLSV